jgi:formate dehydrogenase assembly factor FdhD
MSLSKNEGLSACPCCDRKSLEHNGGYMTCRTCGLAITTRALLRVVRHTQESALFDSTGATH